MGACFVALATGCGVQSPASHDEPRVEVVLFGEHPILRSVLDGVVEGLSVTRPDIEVLVYDAGFQPGEAAQQSALAFSNKPSAVVALGTPAIQAALGQKRSGTPLFFGASSDPAGLGLLPRGFEGEWSEEDLIRVNGLSGVLTGFDYRLAARIAQIVLEEGGMAGSTVGYPITDEESNSLLAALSLERELNELGLSLQRQSVAQPTDVGEAVARLVLDGAGIVQIGPDNTVVAGLSSAEAAVRGRQIPILSMEKASVESGASIGSGPDFGKLGEQLGRLIGSTLEASGASLASEVTVFASSKIYVNSAKLSSVLGPDASARIVAALGALGTPVEILESDELRQAA